MTQHSEYFTQPSSLSTETGHPMTLRPQLRFPQLLNSSYTIPKAVQELRDTNKETGMKMNKIMLRV